MTDHARESLRTLLDREGRLTPERTMRLVARLAEGLQVSHAGGIIHGDLRPEHVLITQDDNQDDNVDLTGTGLAGDWSATVADSAVRSLYVAPEQVSGSSITAATDIYALRVVTHECLAGRQPFRGETPLETALMRLQETPPQLPTEIPPTVRNIVTAALAKDPAARWSSATSMADAAKAALRAMASSTRTDR